MTPGATGETVDGMTLGKIEAIIAALRAERYRWTPVRRIYIEKKDSTKKRPLGLPTWSDKLLQEVIRSLLEAYYEPQFSDHSHGFRPGRGCHTALLEINRDWRGTTWFIEGDIKGCFDRVDHAILLSILAEKIHDDRFLRLIGGLLQAGYLEEWRYHATLSGVPQGGIVSARPLEHLPGPVGQVHRARHAPCLQPGNTTDAQPAVHAAMAAGLAAGTARGPGRGPGAAQADEDHARPVTPTIQTTGACGTAAMPMMAARLQRPPAGSRGDQGRDRAVPARAAQAGAVRGQDPDHPRADAGRAVPRLRDGGAARRRQARSARSPQHQRSDRAESARWTSSAPSARPTCTRASRSAARSGSSILTSVSSPSSRPEYRGVVEYYRLAFNRHKLGRLKWVMERSLTKTLARKFRISVPQVYRRYRAILDTEHGPARACRSRWTGTGNRRW